MKESMWGVLIVTLGLLGIVIVQALQSVTVTNDQNYYLLKEAAEAAMLDSVDLTHYRKTGQIRIVEDKFVENVTRRFAESAQPNRDYDIVVHEILENPPLISISLGSHVFSLKGDEFKIKNSIDSILETKYSFEDIEDYIEDSLELSCLSGDCELNTCISGDLRFVGWEDVSLPQAYCEENIVFDSIERLANYQVCENGKWKSEFSVVSAPPVKKTKYISYTWNFNKTSQFRNINESITANVEFGKCITSILICPPEGITLNVGETIRLKPTYVPSDAINKELKWSSNSHSVSVIGSIDGLVRGVSVGEGIITAVSSNGKYATCKINVINSPKNYSCPKEKTVLKTDESKKIILGGGVVPSNAKWETDPDYATIDNNGVIKAGFQTCNNCYFSVKFGNETLQCPFIIDDGSLPYIILECDKEEMNISEEVVCSAKSSIIDDGKYNLECYFKNKKIKPNNLSKDTIICSSDEAGTMTVRATKENYLEDFKYIDVIGEKSFGLDCKKSANDPTPISTGVNFDTTVTCEVTDGGKADLKFDFIPSSSYGASAIKSKIAENSKEISITTGKIKGELTVTAKRGVETITYTYEVGCIPGQSYALFPEVKLPDLCPQHFELRQDKDREEIGIIDDYKEHYKEILSNRPLKQQIVLCGHEGYTKPSSKIQYNYETGIANRNYRSYYDTVHEFDQWISNQSPTMFPEKGEYTVYNIFSYSFDIKNYESTNTYRIIKWPLHSSPYINTQIMSKSRTYTGKLLDRDDPICKEFEKEHKLKPNIKPSITLRRIYEDNDMLPEQGDKDWAFFLQAVLSPVTDFVQNKGEWKVIQGSIYRREHEYNWLVGRFSPLPTANVGTATVQFKAYLTEEAKARTGLEFVTATHTFKILDRCEDLFIEAFVGKEKIDPNNIYAIGEEAIILRLNKDTEGNPGVWEFITKQSGDSLEYGALSKEQILKLGFFGAETNISNQETIIKYTRTADKCPLTIKFKRIIDTEGPKIEVYSKGEYVSNGGTVYAVNNQYKLYGPNSEGHILHNGVENLGDLVIKISDDKTIADNIRVIISGLDDIPKTTDDYINVLNDETYEIKIIAEDEYKIKSTFTFYISVSKQDLKGVSCKVEQSIKGWTNQDVTVTGKCVPRDSETRCGSPSEISYTFNKSMNKYVGPGPSESIWEEYYIYDSKGQKVVCGRDAQVQIDKEAPTIPLLYAEYQKLILSATDSLSGLKEIKYTLTGANNINERSIVSGVPVRIENTGTTNIKTYSIDKVGNKSAEKTYKVYVEFAVCPENYTYIKSERKCKNNTKDIKLDMMCNYPDGSFLFKSDDEKCYYMLPSEGGHSGGGGSSTGTGGAGRNPNLWDESFDNNIGGGGGGIGSW